MPGGSRLTIDVTDQQHQTLKANAALQGNPMKQYAIERLFPTVADEVQALQELKALFHIRLTEAERGEVLEQSAMEIAEGEFRKSRTA